MKCTQCGNEVKPVMAFDLDNSFSDYTGNLVEFATRYFGWRTVPDVRLYDGTERIGDWLGLRDHDYRQMKLAYRQGGGKRTQPVLKGAGALVEGLQRAGVEVWITTTRPYNRFDSTDPDTRWWLEYHGIPYDHLLFDDDKYGQLHDIVGERCIAVVEDLIGNYDRADNLGLNPILAKFYPYNSAYDRPNQSPNIGHLFTELSARFVRWTNGQ